MPKVTTFEMGLTHAEFFRTLPSALQHTPYTRNGSLIAVDHAGGTVTITLKPQQQRRIALLSVPYTPVTFEFDALSETAIRDFMEEFMRYYQRGGG